MDEAVRQALATDRTIDITTTGRQSGRPRRIEIWFHHIDGRTYITGTPGKRSWYANLQEHPSFVFHLKGSATADLPAVARPITDPAERRKVLTEILRRLADIPGSGERDLDDWLARSPLVEVIFDA